MKEEEVKGELDKIISGRCRSFAGDSGNNSFKL